MSASRITSYNVCYTKLLRLVTGTVEYCNAGHEPPFVGGAGRSLERFPIAEGPPLCVVEDFSYETNYRELAPGQWICVLSDGVTEATRITSYNVCYTKLLRPMPRDAPVTNTTLDVACIV